jgi:hypothetical protein
VSRLRTFRLLFKLVDDGAGKAGFRSAAGSAMRSRAGALVVLLAHARTDTRWFHDWVYGKADEIRFVRGRLRFGDGRQSAPFPSLVAVFLPAHRRQGKNRSMLSL